MATKDTCCTLVPYFNVHEGKLDEFKVLCDTFVEKSKTEPKCMFYAFSFSGQEAHCREGYADADADALLAHLDNVGAVLQEALKFADISRLEIHGPATELKKLHAPLHDLGPRFFNLESGFRR